VKACREDRRGGEEAEDVGGAGVEAEEVDGVVDGAGEEAPYSHRSFLEYRRHHRGLSE